MVKRDRNRSQRRADHRFLPGGGAGTLELEPRELLSHTARGAVIAAPRAHTARLTPAAQINAAYDVFTKNFAGVEQAYVQSINDQANGSVTVSANLSQPYAVGASTMVVDNASVFGPVGTFTAPVVATATINGVPNGAQYVFTGRSGANTLIVNPGQSSQVPLSPPGVALTATIPSTSQTSAAAIFPSFIVNRTNQMAIDLVQYFNGLPLKLPKFNNPPHTPMNRGAIQSYVYNSVAGSNSTSLQQSLLAIPLPTTAGSDLKIYDAAVQAAIAQSRTVTLNGVSQVYAGRLLVSAPAPNNRYGVNLNTIANVPAYILGKSTTGTG